MLLIRLIYILTIFFVAGLDTEGDRKDNLRSKPLSGKLRVIIKGARELDHAPIVTSGRARSSSKQVSETYVSLKVEGTQRARSHGSRTDRWNEEFEISVDKANEVEIAVYDKQVSEPHPVPIGLLWIRISDLVEAQRRQKVMMESDAGGWVTAGAMGGGPNAGGIPSHLASAGDMNAPLNFGIDGGIPPGSAMGGHPSQAEGVEAWFAVEPAGALALQLNFGEETAILSA
jgi:C2 domain